MMQAPQENTLAGGTAQCVEYIKQPHANYSVTPQENQVTIEYIDDRELEAGEITEEIGYLVCQGVIDQKIIDAARRDYLSRNNGDLSGWATFMFPRVKKALAEARSPAIEAGAILANDNQFTLSRASDLAREPTYTASLVKGVLPAEGFGMIYGPSGSAKGFFALDVTVAVASGTPWLGRKVTKAPVVIVNLEGGAAFPNRLHAWEKKFGALPDAMLVLNDSPFAILDEASVDALARAINQAGANGGLTVIDTLARAAGGIDENSSEAMGRVIAGVERLQRAVGGLVLLVHHIGKDSTKGPRGHSSMLAALDCAIEISREGNLRTWRLAKAKDGDDGVGGQFRLEVVELGNDADGDPITSCVVEHLESPFDEIRASGVPKSGNQLIAYNTLNELLDQSLDLGKGGADPSTPCIRLEDAVIACRDRLTTEPKRRGERARLAIGALVSRGLFRHENDWLWRPNGRRPAQLQTSPSSHPAPLPVSLPPKGGTGKSGNMGDLILPKRDESGKSGNTRAEGCLS